MRDGDGYPVSTQRLRLRLVPNLTSDCDRSRPDQVRWRLRHGRGRGRMRRQWQVVSLNLDLDREVQDVTVEVADHLCGGFDFGGAGEHTKRYGALTAQPLLEICAGEFDPEAAIEPGPGMGNWLSIRLVGRSSLQAKSTGWSLRALVKDATVNPTRYGC